MSEKISYNNLLASLAVFRNLDERGKSTTEILIEFLIDIMKTEKLYSFDVVEINSLLQKMYDFQIPDAIISTVLKKIDFLSYRNYRYNVHDTSQLHKYNLDEQKQGKIQENNLIFTKLYKYIEEKTENILAENEKSKIEQAFANFILDNVIRLH